MTGQQSRIATRIEEGLHAVADITPDPISRPVTAVSPVVEATAPALPAKLNPRGYVKPKRRRTPRVLAWLAVATSTFVLVGSAAAYLGYKKLENNLVKMPIEALKPNPPAGAAAAPGAVVRPPKAPGAKNDTNYLIIGSDSREGASAADLKAFSTEDEPGQRSDTMLLVNIPAGRDGAYVLSFPRDLYVEIPGEDGKHKINSAFSKGGPSLAISTVEQLTRVHIDHYIEIKFASFLRMVNALDGVEICVPKAMKSQLAGLNLKAGTQMLNGSQALSYVRARSFDKDSEYQDGRADLGRIERQQKFLGAMVQRATSSDVLLRPNRLIRFLDRGTKALGVDDGLSTNDLKELGLRFRDLDPKKVVFATVPNYDPGKKIGGQNVLLLSEDEAEQIFTAIRDGSMREDGTPAQAPSIDTGPKLTVAPANIHVRVLNGTDVKGKAGEVRDDLKARGYLTGDIGTAPSEQQGETATVIRYGPDREESARTLNQSIPDSRVELDETLGSTLTVIVGSDYAGTRKVTVAQPRPSGSSSPAPKPKTAADASAC
ncbi:MAG: LCP family protein [Mycobacteriales bacterium]